MIPWLAGLVVGFAIGVLTLVYGRIFEWIAHRYRLRLDATKPRRADSFRPRTEPLDVLDERVFQAWLRDDSDRTLEEYAATERKPIRSDGMIRSELSPIPSPVKSFAPMPPGAPLGLPPAPMFVALAQLQARHRQLSAELEEMATVGQLYEMDAKGRELGHLTDRIASLEQMIPVDISTERYREAITRPTMPENILLDGRPRPLLLDPERKRRLQILLRSLLSMRDWK